MSRIKINNFGPIREGFTENEGWMNINKVTVFTGDQGSGKSTVAKLISLFFWIEKNIVRNTISADQLNVNIFKNLCNQQEIFEYFSEDTFISFEGDAFNFIYDNKTLSFKATANNGCKNYILPKIQYVSAARNLLTILYNISGQIIDKDNNIVDLSSNIPFMVRVLNIEYRKALEVFAKNGLLNNEKTFMPQDNNNFIWNTYKDVKEIVVNDKTKITKENFKNDFSINSPMLARLALSSQGSRSEWSIPLKFYMIAPVTTEVYGGLSAEEMMYFEPRPSNDFKF